MEGQEKFTRFLSLEIKSLQKQVLDLCELVVPESNWDHFRKRLLDITNNVRRKLQDEVATRYIINYDPSAGEDIVKVMNNKGKEY
jgi:hypothetical protein